MSRGRRAFHDAYISTPNWWHFVYSATLNMCKNNVNANELFSQRFDGNAEIQFHNSVVKHIQKILERGTRANIWRWTKRMVESINSKPNQLVKVSKQRFKQLLTCSNIISNCAANVCQKSIKLQEVCRSIRDFDFAHVKTGKVELNHVRWCWNPDPNRQREKGRRLVN